MLMKNRIRKSRLTNSILAVVVLFCSIECYAESLYVFYPTTRRPKVMQSEMKNACPSIEIKVFGRYRDFSTSVKETPPDAILTKTPVIEKIEGYSIKLSGSRKGATKEPYILLSVDTKVDPGNLGNSTVGVLDILGRKGMSAFVGKYFSPLPKIKRVPKMEDLLSLLTFKEANAILIPEVYVNYFKGLSKSNLVSAPVPGMQVGIIDLAVKNGRSADVIIKAVKATGAASTTFLEVDNWK